VTFDSSHIHCIHSSSNRLDCWEILKAHVDVLNEPNFSLQENLGFNLLVSLSLVVGKLREIVGFPRVTNISLIVRLSKR
jgi:hypothetical protein